MRINATFPASLFGAIFCTLISLPRAEAQPRFKAGPVVGITASQIDGDLSAGYNKLGLQGGLRVIGRLRPRTEGSLEFLFSQRGCQSELLKGNRFDDFPFGVTLNYVEIPVQWHYKDWLIEGADESKNYYRMAFNIGLSYARLISTKLDDETSWLRGIVPDYLKKNDVSFVVGFNFFANRHLVFTARYNRSIGQMYDPRDHDPAPAQRGWNGHCLYFQGGYMF
jgi:hypothetical protein